MSIADLAVVAVCAALGFGIMRNMLGASKLPRSDRGQADEADRETDRND